MTVYLLHSDQPVGTPGGHIARHYVGWTPEGEDALLRRIQSHQSGHGDAALPRALVENGGELELVYWWPNADKKDERRIKNQGHHDRFCWKCHLAESYRLRLQFPIGGTLQWKPQPNTP